MCWWLKNHLERESWFICIDEIKFRVKQTFKVLQSLIQNKNLYGMEFLQFVEELCSSLLQIVENLLMTGSLQKKSSKSCLSNYRTISILFVQNKVFKKVIISSILEYLRELTSNMVFRKNKSTANLLSFVIHLWYKYL